MCEGLSQKNVNDRETDHLDVNTQNVIAGKNDEQYQKHEIISFFF